MTIPTGTAVLTFNKIYDVRSHARLDDGTYKYSDIYTFKVYDVADYLYQNRIINSQSSYNYICNQVLKVANAFYEAVVFIWDNKVAIPIVKS